MASWDEPTGETPAVSDRTGETQTVPRRRQSAVDQAVARLLISALVVTIAVLAFLFGRARLDSAGAVTTTTSTLPIAAVASTTSAPPRSKVATTATTAPPATSAPSPAVAVVPPISAPASTQTTQTTAPPTTATSTP